MEHVSYHDATENQGGNDIQIIGIRCKRLQKGNPGKGNRQYPTPEILQYPLFIDILWIQQGGKRISKAYTCQEKQADVHTGIDGIEHLPILRGKDFQPKIQVDEHNKKCWCQEIFCLTIRGIVCSIRYTQEHQDNAYHQITCIDTLNQFCEIFFQ